MRVSRYHRHPKAVVQRSFPQGFTLVEVLLAVVILSVIAGLAVPNFSRGYRRFRLKKAAGDLAYAMRYAQSRAVVKNRQVKLEFDSEFSGYRLWEEIVDGAPAFQKMTGRFGKFFNLPEGLKTEGDVSAVSFYPDGSMDRQRFYVCDDHECFTVSTKEQRGHVRLFRAQPEGQADAR